MYCIITHNCLTETIKNRNNFYWVTISCKTIKSCVFLLWQKCPGKQYRVGVEDSLRVGGGMTR